MSLRIQLLGPPQIERDGDPLDLPGYRPLALLAYLLVTARLTAASIWLIFYLRVRMTLGPRCAGR